MKTNLLVSALLLTIFSSMILVSAATEATKTTTIPERTIEIVKKFVSNYSIDGINNHIILENTAQIPYKSDRINPTKYKNIVQPPISEIDNNIQTVTLYTWTENQGLLLEWKVKVKDDVVTHLYVKTIDVGVGCSKLNFEPFLPSAGSVLVNESAIEKLNIKSFAALSPADPAQIQVSDHRAGGKAGKGKGSSGIPKKIQLILPSPKAHHTYAFPCIEMFRAYHPAAQHAAI